MSEKLSVKSTERLEVSRSVAAPPEKVFALLTEPRGHVAIDSSGMLQAADGKLVEAVGDEFVVHMDREALNDAPIGKYDVTVLITRYETNSHLEWTVLSARTEVPVGHRYGYRLEPLGTGTLVRSYYDWSQIDPRYRGKISFPTVGESALRATLGILARTVE
ncbi:SRPBCC family protein [Promicromonospora sp. NFX87]|uniref:SRPBCC family protein n=1 Tax=Promicromonospora sp. NFX87 TaxID=3402691 RepID=UPI003AFB0113